VSEAFNTETIVLHGIPVRIELAYDNDHGMPWDECDGHGIIRKAIAHYGRPEKSPGEVIIHSDRGHYWLYDFKGTTEKAKSEGWGISGNTSVMTKRQIVRAAVMRDMEHCREWLTGERYYIGITVTALNADGEEIESDSCWGFDYGCSREDMDYVENEAKEMAARIAESVFDQKRQAWRAALREARQRRYWETRDIVTA
jgi:hypothetical protein